MKNLKRQELKMLARKSLVAVLCLQISFAHLATAQDTNSNTNINSSTISISSANSPLFSQRIQGFIDRLSTSVYALQTTEEEMQKAIEVAGIEGLIRQTGIRAAIVRGEEFANTEDEIKYRELENAIAIEAEEIASDLYESNSTEDLNLKLLVLAHHYLYNPASRGAIREIATGFDSMIGENYFRELEKKKTSSDQYLDGTLWTGLILGLLSLRKPSQGTKTYLTMTQEKSFEFMKRLKGRMISSRARGGRLATEAAQTVVQSADNVVLQNNSKEAVIESLRKMGAYIPRERHDLVTQSGKKMAFYSPQMLKFYSKNFVAGLSRYFTRDYILNWMRTRSASDNFKNFLFLTGASTAGGALYMGTRQTYQAFQTVDIGDQYIDLRELISRDYTELSTLMLQCQMKALKEEVSLIPEGEEKWSADRLQFLRAWLADYELLRRFSLDAGVTQKRLTSMPVHYDVSRGAYVAQIKYLEHTVEEVIPCVAPTRGTSPQSDNTNSDSTLHENRAELSLEEALLDLTLVIQ